MRTFNSEIGEAFRAGLVRSLNTPRNTGGLLAATNCQIGDAGPEGYMPKINMSPDYLGHQVMEVDWPFPQIFHTDTGIYFCNREKILKVTLESDGEIQYDVILDLSEEDFDVDWPWTLVDVPNSPMFISGDCMVYKYYDTEEEEYVWKAYSHSHEYGSCTADVYPVSHSIAGCFCNGQIIMVGSKIGGNCNQVSWSEIGVRRFFNGSVGDNNTSGVYYVPDAVDDILMRCLPMGKNVIVYGMFGIYAMVPVAEPVPTFSIFRIAGTGICNPLAACAGQNEHIFVDRLGCLWMIGPDLKPKNLDYQHIFEDEEASMEAASVSSEAGVLSFLQFVYRKFREYILAGHASSMQVLLQQIFYVISTSNITTYEELVAFIGNLRTQIYASLDLGPFEDIYEMLDYTYAEYEASIGTPSITRSFSILYNKMDDEYYIGDGQYTWLFKDGKLTKIGMIITGICDLRMAITTGRQTLREDVDIFYNYILGFSSYTDEIGFKLQTSTIDFKTPGLKVLEQVYVNGYTAAGTLSEIMVEYRNNPYGAFNETTWRTVNPNGVAYVNVAGQEFRINFRCTPATGTQIEKLSLTWKRVDRRYIRGIFDASMSGA